MLNILFIDEVGIPFNGATLYNRGLGGSESAIILLSQELVKIGFGVTVLNHSITKNSNSGIFDNVIYYDFSELDKLSTHYDIVISSRSAKPFLPSPNNPYKFISNTTYKIVWLHDTFCEGDEYLENLLVTNHINEIFTLSDFHTNYILNANHGRKRQYEVLKNKVFQTRNGAQKHPVSYNKNKNNFVYNSSITKGLIPLLTDIWPTIKQNIPSANLTVIGGYYDLPNNDYNEAKEKLLSFKKNNYYKSLDITFTGIIKQSTIAEILANSGFMIYPAIFPETFGISALESLLYNTPIITCRFGALEETALDKSCYLIDYSIEPNSLYPDVIKKDQVSKFIDLVLYAYHNEYLYSQKQQYCSIIEDVYKWETIALQWKQHLYYKLGYFLSKEEYQVVSKINDDVKRIFNRKFSNIVENDKYPIYDNVEKHIDIITPVFNAENYIERCIQSVNTQNYSNYTHYIIDDNSTDNTKNIIKKYLSDKLILIENTENKGAVYNQYNTIINYSNDNNIIVLLDGDDCLVNNNTIFNYYNELHNNYDFTYGSCWSEVDNIPLIAQEYPDNIKEGKLYKSHLFAWNIPYTHLRTFKKFIINDISENKLKQDNEWVKAGGDGALFYELIEQTDIDRIKAVKDIMVMYNDKNPINDYKVNSNQQTITANNIIRKEIDIKSEKFSVIIPTMWKYEPFCRFLEQLVTVDLIDEIIIINNDSKNTPINEILENSKIKLHNFSENIFVNPAWNYGVWVSKNDKLAIINDDIEFDIKLFERVYDYVIPQNGVTGIIYNQYTNFDINISPYTDDNDGFGTCMFIHKNNWKDIPKNLKVYYGDNFIFDNNFFNGRTNYIITNIKYFSKMAATTSLVVSGEIASEGLDKEGEYYELHKQNLITPITKVSDDKIEIFYHVFVPDWVNINSLWWIDEQLSDIEKSNLKNYSNINMCITINKNLIYGYNKTSLESIITYINTKYNFVNILDIRDTSEENIYEQQTLNYLHEFSKHNPNTKILYIHTKGISIFSETQKEWLEILTKTLVYDWKTCIEYLNNNDIVAINDNGNNHRKDNNLQTIVSGNFFWANTNYIATLPNPKDTHIYGKDNTRYDYELWITHNKPKIAFVYNQHTNHYLEIFQDKKILIAIPTDKYIKAETFKSIYDLEVPYGYKIEFQYFYGYRIDQVRNLIAEWGKKYDYLFAVDSDIVLPSDTLRKLLYADKDVVSGLYIQRIENTHNLELFSDNRIPYEDIKGKGLIEVKGCGFGCVLIKSEIFRTMEYPHFLYTHALDHNDTYSEDTYFCDKARSLGYKIYADTTIKCGHIGETTFVVE